MLLLQKTCNLIDIFINGEQRIKTHRYKQNILFNCFHTTRVDLLNQQLVRCFKCSVYALSRKLLSSIKGQINARSCVLINSRLKYIILCHKPISAILSTRS